MRTSLVIAALTALVTPAAAQNLPDWVSANGHFSSGYSNRVPGADAFFAGDATLRFAPAFAGPFGLELGFYGRADALDTPHETYGALTWDIGSGRLSLGVPRPAYDGFAVSALETSFPSLSIDRTATTRSAATAGAMFGNWLPYGVTFTNTTGSLRYGASVHRADNVDATVAGFGVATDLGDWQVSGAVEVVWGTAARSGTDVNAKLQAKTGHRYLSGGAGYYVAANAPDLIEGFATYLATDRIALSGVVQVPTDGTDPTAGFSARYRFTDHTALSVGIATDAGSDPVFNAFIDFRF